jgi:SAM-dependent methyltransferase
MNPPADPPSTPPSEFDSYAQSYNAGMDSPVKAMMGGSADDFVAIKIRWLLRRYPDLAGRGASFRLLDYGCGTATLLRLIAPEMPGATLLGCDISAGMLHEAARVWPAHSAAPSFHQQDGAKVPLPSESCDLVVISAVLHHVPLDERAAVYAEIGRLLRPGGRLVVFEHNPVNPVTRYVVSRTPIDQNAILLHAGEVQSSLRSAGFSAIETGYLMFLPPRLQILAGLERLIGWLPLGAQYAVTARHGVPNDGQP